MPPDRREAKKHDRVCDLLRGEHPADGRTRDEVLLDLLRGDALGDGVLGVELVDVLGLDDARVQGVHGDPRGAQLVRQGLGHVHDRDVAHPGQRMAGPSRETTDVDDASVAAVVACAGPQPGCSGSSRPPWC